MKQWTPLAYPGPGDTHRNANPAGGVPRGSWPDGVGYQQIIDELCGVVTGNGLALAESDSQQLLRAIRSHRANFVEAANVAGTANAITLALSPTFAALPDLIGTPLVFLAEAANTGAVTIAVDGLAAQSVTWPDGTALAAGDLATALMVVVRYDGTAFRLLSSLSPARVSALIKREVPLGGNWTWSQALADGVLTTLGGGAYTGEGSLNISDATFTGGVFTAGAASAGLYFAGFTAICPTAGTDLFTSIPVNAGTAIGYSTSQSSTSAPGITAVAVRRLAAGDNLRFNVRQFSGGSQALTGRLSIVRLGA